MTIAPTPLLVDGDPATEAILATITDDLPSRAAVAIHVMLLTDDPDIGPADIADPVLRDAGLTARVMRTANSAYYGLAGRATTVQFAISVIGFGTLRALAAAAAAGVDASDQLPPGYLEDAAAVSVAAAALAPRVGVRVPEAQGLGLLHNLGVWLFHRYDEPGYRRIRERGGDRRALAQAEREAYGTTNGQLAALLLANWGMSASFADALALHADRGQVAHNPLRTVLLGGIALAEHARDESARTTREQQEALSACFALPDLAALSAEVRSGAAQLASALR
jgi:HD-like signal output (HDOD) protein